MSPSATSRTNNVSISPLILDVQRAVLCHRADGECQFRPRGRDTRCKMDIQRRRPSIHGSLNTDPNLQEFGSEQQLHGFSASELEQMAGVIDDPGSPGLRAVLDISNESYPEPLDLNTSSRVIQRPKSSGISLNGFSFAKPHHSGRSRPSDSLARTANPTLQTSTATERGRGTMAASNDEEEADRHPP